MECDWSPYFQRAVASFFEKEEKRMPDEWERGWFSLFSGGTLRDSFVFFSLDSPGFIKPDDEPDDHDGKRDNHEEEPWIATLLM